MYQYSHTYIHVTIENKKGCQEFERELGVINGMVCRGREGTNFVITLQTQKKN